MGSEMCIRDSPRGEPRGQAEYPKPDGAASPPREGGALPVVAPRGGTASSRRNADEIGRR